MEINHRTRTELTSKSAIQMSAGSFTQKQSHWWQLYGPFHFHKVKEMISRPDTLNWTLTYSEDLIRQVNKMGILKGHAICSVSELHCMPLYSASAILDAGIWQEIQQTNPCHFGAFILRAYDDLVSKNLASWLPTFHFTVDTYLHSHTRDVVITGTSCIRENSNILHSHIVCPSVSPRPTLPW